MCAKNTCVCKEELAFCGRLVGEFASESGVCCVAQRLAFCDVNDCPDVYRLLSQHMAC